MSEVIAIKVLKPVGLQQKDSQYSLFPFNVVAAQRGTSILQFYPQLPALSAFGMQIWVFGWPWEGIDLLNMWLWLLRYVSWDRFPDWSPFNLMIAEQAEEVCNVGREGKKLPIFLVVYTHTRLTGDAPVSKVKI